MSEKFIQTTMTYEEWIDRKYYFLSKKWNHQIENRSVFYSGKGEVMGIPYDDWFSSQKKETQEEIIRRLWLQERARIIAWLDSMKPGENPYTRGSSEIERKAAMRMWERMREAIEGGKDAPKGESA